MKPFPTRRSCFLALATLLLCIGCSKKPAPVSNPASQRRIVSLSAAITQMLRDLNLGNQIVGVGEIDPVAPEGVAVVGHFRQIDYEKLLAVNPTHVLLQDTAKEPLSEKMQSLAEKHGWTIVRCKLETMEDVYAALPKLGETLGVSEQARELADRTRRQLQAIQDLTAPRSHSPSTLLAVGAEPQIMAAAPGTFLDTLLTTVGGTNCIKSSAVLYPEVDAERLLALAPVLVVHIRMPGSRQMLTLPAASTARIVVLEDAAALLPSTSAPRIAAKLAKLLHPDLADRLPAE